MCIFLETMGGGGGIKRRVGEGTVLALRALLCCQVRCILELLQLPQSRHASPLSLFYVEDVGKGV